MSGKSKRNPVANVVTAKLKRTGGPEFKEVEKEIKVSWVKG